MDKIEQYYKDHAPELDVLEPDPESWNRIVEGLEEKPRPRTALYLLVAAGLALVLTFALLSRPPQPGEEIVAERALKVGDPFPELVLDNQFGDPVALCSLQG